MLPTRPQFADFARYTVCQRCRFPRVALLASFALMAGIAAHACAEDDILKLVPEQALGFAIIHQAAAADAKLQQLGQQMNLPIPSLLAKLQGPGGIRKGLDKNRPIALLLLPPKDDKSPPAVIALVPVSDYAKFLEQFKSEDTEAGVSKIEIWGSPCIVRGIGGYAAITVLPFREALEKDLKLADAVPAVLVPWQSWLKKKDAAVVVLAPGIRSLSAKVQQGIAAIKPILAQAGGQAKQAAAALDMYVTLFQAAEKQVAAFGLGAELDAQGVVRISKRACLMPGGDWAAFVAGAKPSKQNVLAGLPEGPFVFAGGGPLSEATARKMMDFSFGMIKSMHDVYGLSEEQAKTISELSQVKFPAVRGFSFVLGAGQSGEPIFARMLAIMRIDSRETFLANYEEFVAHYNRVVEKISSPVFQPIQLEKTEFDGTPALKVTMSVPQMPNMPPESVKMMERIYGPGGKIVAWVVPCNDRSVVLSYMGQEPLRRMIAAIQEGKAGLAGDAGVAKVTALLPPGATWSGYCSPKGLFDFLSRTIAAAAPHARGVKIPEFAPTPPLAIALIPGHDEVEIQLIVPAEVVKAVGGLINRYLRPVAVPSESPKATIEEKIPGN